MDNEIKKKPIRTFKCGSVQLSVWVDDKVIDNEVVEVHSIRIDRAYRQGETWAHTNTLNVEDLPKVALLAHEAYRSLRVRTFEPAPQADEHDNDPDGEGNSSQPTGERR